MRPAQVRVPMWTVASAIGAPLVLVVGAILANAVRTASYDPLTQTMSALAAKGGGDWIMTAGFVLSAGCQIITAVGLKVLQPVSRAALALVGCCGLAVAAFPVTVETTADAHLIAVGVGAVMMALWPVLCISTRPTAPLALRARWAGITSLVLCALVLWMFYEARTGAIIGLAERITVVVEMMWPLVVVIAARRGEVPPEP